jgi:hypothetical protein
LGIFDNIQLYVGFLLLLLYEYVGLFLLYVGLFWQAYFLAEPQKEVRRCWMMELLRNYAIPEKILPHVHCHGYAARNA